MRPLLAVSTFIDNLNERLGYLADWAVVLACAISAGNAMVRYAFDMSSNAWLEIQWYLFTATVMLGASYTLNRNEHVRVDITYMMLSERGKEWLDLMGTLFFLLPTMSLLAWLSWPVFSRAWTSDEISGSAGGLVRWPVLFLMPFGFALITMQGVSEVIKRIAALRGYVRYETHYERPVQ
ncbi:MAG TPA: TRAP transporter small permease subunit [Usitatibacter sp.]|nr:TRAP transporter small permease subunit [Usitatibacter sp.]